MEQQNELTHYYELLGLSPGASVDEIRTQFKKMVRVYHPDRFVRDDEKIHVAQKLRDINEAYTVLTGRQSVGEPSSLPEGARERSALRPQPALEPEMLDFGQVTIDGRERLVFRVDNQGAEARRFGLSVNAKDNWFNVATGKQVDEESPFPVEFTVLANAQALVPGEHYDGWIDVTMDSTTKRLPVSMDVAEKPSAFPNLVALRWATAAMAILALLLFVWLRVPGNLGLVSILQNFGGDENSLQTIAQTDEGPEGVADQSELADAEASDQSAPATEADSLESAQEDAADASAAATAAASALTTNGTSGDASTEGDQPSTFTLSGLLSDSMIQTGTISATTGATTNLTATESSTATADVAASSAVTSATGATLTAVMRAGVVPPQPEAFTPTVVTPQTESVIARIRERGQLVAGVQVDARPFSFRQENGQLTGFNIDLVRALAAEWLGDSEAVAFVPVSSSDRMERLANGDIDLIAATMTHTKGREEFVDFSQTYFLAGANLLVRAGSGIETLEDLRGARIAVVEDTTTAVDVVEFLLASRLIREDSDLLEGDFEIVGFERYTEAINPLIQGDVDALATSSGILAGVAQTVAEESPDNPALTLLLEEDFALQPYGFGVPTNDSYFKNLVDFSLQDLKREGVYDELYAKWFGEDSAPYALELLPGDWPYTLEDSPVTLDTDVPSVVEKLITEGEFIAGISYVTPLFGFRDESGQVTGFEADILREFARRWLGDANAVQFVPVNSAERIEKLANREIDIVASGLTHTQDRDELIDFSQVYFFDGQNILVREGDGINSIADLDGRVIATSVQSTSGKRILAVAEENGIEIELAEFTQITEMIRPLLEGDVDAITTDRGILLGIAQANPGLTLLLDEEISLEPYGMGVPNFDHHFRALVNFTLQEMYQDGTYGVLYRHWFGTQAGLGSDVDVYEMEVWPGNGYLTKVLAPMVEVEAGEFRLGRETGDEIVPVEYDAKPARTVSLDSFYIDQYEVTNRLYTQCVDAGICSEPETTGLLRDPEYYFSDQFGSHPVIYVSWNDAQTYCEYVDKTLPTELQWEKAARGPFAADSEFIHLFPWGDAYDRDEPRASYDDNYLGFPQLVGSYRYNPSGVSPFGVHDMAGNVREWTSSCYEQRYYDALEDGAIDPPANDVCEVEDNRVVRGGGWNELIFDLTTTRRQGVTPTETDRNLGFRCVSDVGPIAGFRTDLFAATSQ